MKRIAFPIAFIFLAGCAPTPPAPPAENTESEPIPVAEPIKEEEQPEGDEGDGMMMDEEGDVQVYDLAPMPVDDGLPVNEMQQEEASDPVEEPGPPSASGPRVIQVTAQNWSFTPSIITARKGEVVQLSITGAGGLHGFAVPSLGINENIAPGQTVTINLPTDRAGTFPLLCSVPCGSGHRDMTGQIIIEE